MLVKSVCKNKDGKSKTEDWSSYPSIDFHIDEFHKNVKHRDNFLYNLKSSVGFMGYKVSLKSFETIRECLNDNVRIEIKDWNIATITPLLLKSLLRYKPKLVEQNQFKNKNVLEFVKKILYQYVIKKNEACKNSYLCKNMIIKMKTVKVENKSKYIIFKSQIYTIFWFSFNTL